MKPFDFDICEDCSFEFACHAQGIRCYTDDVDEISQENDWFERL